MPLESLVVSLCPWCPLLHVLSVFLELLQYPNHPPPPRRTVLFPHESCLYCMYNTTYKPFRPHHANPHAHIPSRSDCPRLAMRSDTAVPAPSAIAGKKTLLIACWGLFTSSPQSQRLSHRWLNVPLRPFAVISRDRLTASCSSAFISLIWALTSSSRPVLCARSWTSAA